MRRYCDADHDEVWALHNIALIQVGAHPGNGSWDDDLHAIGAVYLESGGEFLVGEYDGALVAMGALLRLSPTSAEIKRMRVHPTYQRRGFGRAILQQLEARAQDLGYRELTLETTVQQVAAQALYRAMGYAETRRFQLGPYAVIAYAKRLG
jgi:ribosomal protein S18 acetylase RimI-like enzyme